MDIAYRPYVDPQFERLIDRIHPPRVCIDNDTCRDCTLVKVDSQNKHGILLEMVQVLTDLDLVISKSYICSDGGWLMDVFHVTDQLGQKLRDEELIRYIEQALGPDKEDAHSVKTCLGRVVGSPPSAARRVLEITATDRPGLLSEISGVLQDMNCNIETAHLWTHNSRMACIVVAADLASCKPITDTERLDLVKDQLCNVLSIFNGSRDERRAVRVSTLRPGLTHTERRLHQMMFEDRDYDSGVEMDKGAIKKKVGDRPKLSVSLDHCIKDYSVLNILSKDRPKLLFDTICTLSDLQYVVFHAAIGSDGPLAMQEYFIQHEDGCTLKTDSERSRLVKCLEAGIERRVTDGLRLEVQTHDRVGLLSDITREFREHGLMVKRAEISTIGNKAFDTFYVAEVSGNEAVNMKIVEHIRQQFGCVVVGERSDLMTHRSGSSSNHHQHRSRNEPERQKSFSLSHMIWSQIERISQNFAHN